MKKTFALLFVVCLTFAAVPSSFALPDHSYDRIYYNSSGSEVGYESLWCNAHYSMTGTQTDMMLEYDSPCGDIQPITCNDVGLDTNDGGECVTEGLCLWQQIHEQSCTYPQ